MITGLLHKELARLAVQPGRLSSGAFVDNALNLASQQRDFQIEREIESKASRAARWE